MCDKREIKKEVLHNVSKSPCLSSDRPCCDRHCRMLDFVKTVEQYPFDMDLCRGSVVVDAKSLLGIMNLGFNQTVNLKIYSNDCTDLFHNIEKFRAA